MRRPPSVVIFFSALLIFRMSLDYAYVNYVHVIFESHFLAMRYSWNLWQYAISIILFIFNIFWLRPGHHSVGNLFQLMATLFVVAPLTSQYGLDSTLPVAPVIATIASLFVVRLISELALPQGGSPPSFTYGRSLAVVVSTAGIIYLMVWARLSGALENFNLDPSLVYEFRRENSNLMNVGLLSYINVWVYKIFTIYLLCFALYRRNYFVAFMVFIIQVFFAGVANHKSVFFLPFLSLFFWMFLSRTRSLFLIPTTFAALILLSISAYHMTGDGFAAGILVRRAFYVPSGLTFAWFDFFDDGNYVYWADSVLSWLVRNQYTGLKIPYIVGDYLFYGKELAANNGMVSAGFSHAGYVGVLIYSLLLGGMINVFNRFARSGIPIWFIISLTIGPLRTAIADADLPTSVLTHGIFMAMVLLWLHRNSSDTVAKRANPTVGSWPGSHMQMTPPSPHRFR